MNIITPKETLIELTRLNPFERFEDGRPHVPDTILTRLEAATDIVADLQSLQGRWP